MTARIDVCIATYKRPELLKKLLLSLLGQETAGEFTFSLIVVDNDAQRTAEPLLRELNANGQKIIYAVEPEQNISLARNKALSFATGDYVAMIDDDEYPDSRWLLNLSRAITSHSADVIHGPVIPEFNFKPSRYVQHGFMRPNPPTGSAKTYIMNTGNTLFRRKLIEGMPAPFDPRFGRTGGEDTAFFYQLKRRGCRMVWCQEAVVFELVPKRRAHLSWLLRRKFRNGNLYPQNQGCSHVFRAAQFGFSCVLVARFSCRVLIFAVASIFNSNYYKQSIDSLLEIAFRLGLLAHYVNFHVGNRDDIVSQN